MKFLPLQPDRARAPADLVIIGAGGAGRDTLWTVVRQNAAGAEYRERYTPVGFVDDAPGLKGKTVDGLIVIATIEELLQSGNRDELCFHCAIGNNLAREEISRKLEARGFTPATIVDPSAILAASVVVGAGSFVGASVVITPHARIGRHVLINVGAMIGHDTTVGDYAQVCPGVRLAGHCGIGMSSFIGANAVVAPSVKIGPYSVLGAASLAARDIADNVTAIGVPARTVAPGLKLRL